MSTGQCSRFSIRQRPLLTLLSDTQPWTIPLNMRCILAQTL